MSLRRKGKGKILNGKEQFVYVDLKQMMGYIKLLRVQFLLDTLESDESFILKF